jgi:hypothetical protein
MAIIRFIDVLFYNYLHLPISSMFFFGTVLMLVALLIPEGLPASPLVKRLFTFPAGKYGIKKGQG